MSEAAVPAEDPRLARCARDLRRYAVLLVELALVLAVFRMYRLDDVLGEAFFKASVIAAGGFALHYWLPLRLKPWGFVAISIGGAFAIFEPRVAALLLLVGALFLAVGRSRLAWRTRVLLFVAIGAALAFARARGIPGVPEPFWPVLGSIFVFRLIVWAYDLKHAKTAAPLHDDVAYFFQLPNWGCLLYPVVDWHTMRKSFLARDVHDVAQTGVRWMARGVIQLLAYDWIYYRKPIADPAEIDGPWKLLAFIAMTYLLYLRVSGTFHFVVGVLHLFGYDLPETNRRWALASSISDFWRRINIYWKDFMVKVVYFPVYFRLRRKGDGFAQLAGIACVFVATWALHSWQTFWLDGSFLLRSTDIAFWSALGVLMMVNQLLELRRGKQKPRAAGGAATFVARTLKIAGTFLLLSTLWSMWNARSFAQWFELLTFWRVGG